MLRGLMLGIAMVLTGAAICGQTFEVASVKPMPEPNGLVNGLGPSGGPGTRDPGLYKCRYCSLDGILLKAYDVKMYQLSAPSWIGKELFEINAKVPERSTEEQFAVMLRNLLIERFKLAAHREVKEAVVYELTVMKGGHKMKESTVSETAGPYSLGLAKDGFPMVPPGRTSMTANVRGIMRMRALKETIPQFLARISTQLQAPVTDATGLKGEYAFTLSWSRDVNSGPANPDEEPAPTIFGALEMQLGLKLIQKKGPIEMIVVDHIEKVPTGN